MNITDLRLVSSTHKHPVTKEQENDKRIRIMRSFFLDTSNEDPALTPWDKWNKIALARIAVVEKSHVIKPVFVGHSALLLHGIPLWEANPDIMIWREKRRIRTTLPAVSFFDTFIPSTNVLCHRTAPQSPLLSCGPFRFESCEDAILRLALGAEPLSAFVATCMTFQKLTNFSQFDQKSARRKCKDIQTRLLKRAHEISSHTPGKQQALLILSSATCGCANPAESALLWVVSSLYRGPISTQFEIWSNNHQYFADIALPTYKTIIEFDGIEKLGTNLSDISNKKRRWIQREQDLHDAGWRIIRVNWADFEDFESLRKRLYRLLELRDPTPASCEALWALPSAAQCDGPRRRFHLTFHP